MMKERISLDINGKIQIIEADPTTPLLYILRNNLKLNGPKFGCGLEQCGACMVLIDGEARTSCLLPVAEVRNKRIVTQEGLLRPDGTLHPVQDAIVKEQAAQCGYCVNGIIISAVSLLNKNANPRRQEVIEEMNQVLCRCGTYVRFIRAIEVASERLNK